VAGPSSDGSPLAGVRVLAVEQMIAAPWATQLLARFGAEVIKVEHPSRGEAGRASAPAISAPDGASVGATFLRNNLNKRSVGIDLTRGSELVLRLAQHCDVFVENYKAGALDRLGLGYGPLAARNPRIVYASVSGFGTTIDSPYREWPAYAAVAEAMSGIYEWARPPGGRPVPNPMGGVGDIGAGMFAALGVLIALIDRQRTGRGQHVDIAMLDAMVALADVVPSLWSLGARERAPGAILTTIRARDGFVLIQVSREHQFERLAHAVGHAEWMTDARFGSRQGWVDHLETVLRPALEAWGGGRTKREVCDSLAAAGVPCGPCNDAEDVLTDPHLAARGMLVEFDDGGGSTYVVPGNPIKLSAVAAREDRRSPWLGEDTDAVLHGLLGLATEEIAELRRAGVVG
jgi:crotonobetainyl-CoA:carnitine CoA-transferase CaiB-like acyl-CoA transferase